MVSQEQEQEQEQGQQEQQQVQISDRIILTQWMNDLRTPPRAPRVLVAPGAPDRMPELAEDNDDDDDDEDTFDDAFIASLRSRNAMRAQGSRVQPNRVIRQINFDDAALHVLQTRLQRSIFEDIEGSLLAPRNE